MGNNDVRMSTKRATYEEMVKKNGFNQSAYYTRLRKLREKVCREIVPIESPTGKEIAEIKIVSGDITISLPNTVDRETLTSVLAALKSC